MSKAELKLLVVDDQGPVGEIISRVAKQAGWNAVHSVSADRLDDIIRAEGIHVLLIDFAIDGNPRSPHNGLNVVAKLRERGITIPVIMFSGWPDLIDARRARELNVMRVLEKPLSIQDLRAAFLEARKRCLGAAGAAS